MKLKPISEQVVVIVGATSGIGRAAALHLAGSGAIVVVSGRSLPELNSLVDEIQSKGGQVTPIIVDVSEYDQVKALADRAFAMYGRIDTWVHSAAVMIYSELQDMKPEEFKRLIEVNLLGQVYGAMAALPYLESNDGGALIHISSVESKRALPLQSAYSASKFGLRGFVDALRMEVIHNNLPVSITHLMPASINTPLYDRALTHLGVKPRPVPPVYEPEAVADAILYAAENPVREIHVGGAGKALSLLQRLSPQLAEVFLIPYTYESVKSSEPKSTEAPSNLFWHLPGYAEVRGSYSSEGRRTNKYLGFDRFLFISQGTFYLTTGLWPFINAGSFQKVTGPKTDFWLVKTVGVLVSVIGGVLLSAGLRGERNPELPPLALGSAAGLAGIDIAYVAKRRISPVYLLDAAAELSLIGLWLFSLLRKPEGFSKDKLSLLR